MTKKTAAQLISDSMASAPRGNWLHQLSPGGKTYVEEVVSGLRKARDAPVYIVAGMLKKELKIKRSHGTIARTLKEILDGKEAI